ncbi:MAG: hypothetical protein ACXVWU_02840 [Nocardioides sp.]
MTSTKTPGDTLAVSSSTSTPSAVPDGGPGQHETMIGGRMDQAAAAKACEELLGTPAEVVAYLRSKDPDGPTSALLAGDYYAGQWTGLPTQDIGTATRLFACWLPENRDSHAYVTFDFQEPNVQDPNCSTMWWANELTVCGVGFEVYVKFDKNGLDPDQSLPDVPQATRTALATWLEAVASDVHF